MQITLTKSNRSGKKWQAIFNDGKTVHFGAQGYEDYTMHKDETRLSRYINRHNNQREDWTISGIKTAGFWSRWILWNKPSLSASIKDTQRRFNIKIKLTSKS